MDASEPILTHGANFAESATDELEHDLALVELSATQDTLYEIEQALRRIQDGTYGKCEITRKPIPAERLRAIPWTRFSAAVESDLETQGNLSYLRRGQLGSAHAVRHHKAEEVNDEWID